MDELLGQAMGFRLGIDTGGTHTDLVLIGGNPVCTWVDKVPSTPDDPSIGVIDGVRRVMDAAGIVASELDVLVYGTTVSVNRIIQGGHTRAGLLTTAGFRDVLELGRSYRLGNIYNVQWVAPAPLVSRCNTYEVPERLSFQGDVLVPLDEERLLALVPQLRDLESLAVCFLHSHVQPVHERRARDILSEALPRMPISLSSDLSSVTGEYERASTAAVDAFIKPRLAEHFESLEAKLRNMGVTCPVYTMQSNGGVMTLDAGRKAPVRVMNSGPVAGVIAGADVLRAQDGSSGITLDMGGTSTDVAVVVCGEPNEVQSGELHGHPVSQPTIEVEPIGAGGGSIAWVDDGGALRVGPESAGADPGPACYGAGGEHPTVTDAAVILGYLSPERFLGGRRALDTALAEKAVLTHVANPLGITLEEAAYGIVALASAAGLRAIRRLTVARGLDPRELTLVAFGGAGGLISGFLAEELDVARLLVPPDPGNVSAKGLLLTEPRHDASATQTRLFEHVVPAQVEEMFDSLQHECVVGLADIANADDLAVARHVDVRYYGQTFELTIPVEGTFDKESVSRAFHRQHEERYGHASLEDPLQLVTVRVSATLPMGTIPADRLGPRRPGPLPPTEHRRAFFREWYDTPVYRRDALMPGDRLPGPFIIEEAGSTVVGIPRTLCTVREEGTLVIEDAEHAEGRGGRNA